MHSISLQNCAALILSPILTYTKLALATLNRHNEIRPEANHDRSLLIESDQKPIITGVGSHNQAFLRMGHTTKQRKFSGRLLMTSSISYSSSGSATVIILIYSLWIVIENWVVFDWPNMATLVSLTKQRTPTGYMLTYSNYPGYCQKY